MAYAWRRSTPEHRAELLAYRRLLRRPWHRPPHFEQGCCHYLLTAACYEHRSIVGVSPLRMYRFSRDLLEAFDGPPAAWCLLPNHYHVLVSTGGLKSVVARLGRLHGRCARAWNLEDGTPGRKVWHGVSDRSMPNGDHFWATLNYVHHNPVKHGFVAHWQDWPFSSAADYLREVGRRQALRTWGDYPPGDYGRGWDWADD